VKRPLWVLSFVCSVVLLGSAALAGAVPSTVRASVSSSGQQGNDDSWAPSISPTGRWVGFTSDATNLVRHDNNGQSDAFLRDLRNHTTRLVSVSSSGEQGNGSSGQVSVSRNGKRAVFESQANNLVQGDHNDTEYMVDDIFVRNLRTGTTRLVSVNSAGKQGNSYSYNPSISANGRWVTFTSQASNLVPNDANQDGVDVFVHDLRTGRTEMVDVNSGGEQADTGAYVYERGAISADGHLVIFESDASNLAPANNAGVFVHNLRTGKTKMVTADGWFASISTNGRRVAFNTYANGLVPRDHDDGLDAFVRDLRTGRMTMVSVTTAGRQLDDAGYSCCPSISPNGRWVGFQANSRPLGQDGHRVEVIFVHDMRTGRTEMVSKERSGKPPRYDSSTASLSNRKVAFESELEHLVRGGDDYPYANDIFVHRLFPRP
jgi:Tol biopolymer transport system component